MNGLLRKDLLLIKLQGKTYVFLLAFYAIFALMGNYAFFSCMTAVILLILPLNSFAADELARWDKFAAALPGGRRAVVRGKYQLLLVITGGALVLSALVGLAARLLNREELAAAEMALSILACAAVGLLINCLLFPFLFKYGTTKARLYLAMALGIIFAVVALGVTFMLPNSDAVQRLLPAMPWTGVAVGAVLLLCTAVAVSYRVSRGIYDRKEF